MSWRPAVLLALPVIFGVAALGCAIMLVAQVRTDATIRRLAANEDMPVDVTADPHAMLARIAFLVRLDRVGEVRPYLEALDRRGPDQIQETAHYDAANGLLRSAFDKITDGHIDEAGPLVALARQEYRRALMLEPMDWDAKFNLDVASRLIRDFPSFQRTMGDELKGDRKKIWTDLPGKPEGLP